MPVGHEEYVDALLEGLPSDYALIVSVIESKKRTPSIAEIEALLYYSHETRLVRYNKETQCLSSPSLNYTQGYSNPNSYKSADSGGFCSSYGCSGGNHGGFSDYCGISGGFGRSGGSSRKGHGGG